MRILAPERSTERCAHVISSLSVDLRLAPSALAGSPQVWVWRAVELFVWDEWTAVSLGVFALVLEGDAPVASVSSLEEVFRPVALDEDMARRFQ